MADVLVEFLQVTEEDKALTSHHDLWPDAKPKIQQPREDGQYVLLSGDTYGHPEPSAPEAREEDSDTSEKSPTKKMDFINKLFKAKAKNSDDEATINSIYNHCKGDETDSSHESINAVQTKGVINRKKKKSFYDKKSRQHKKLPGSAKIRPTVDKANKNKDIASLKMDEAEFSIKTSLANPDLKPIITLSEDKDGILQEFDPLWIGDLHNNDKLETLKIVNNDSKPIKPPRNKVNKGPAVLSDNMTHLKMPELKVARMEAIQENELPVEEKIVDEVSKDVKNEMVFAKANVSYEGLEGVFAKPIVHNQFEIVKETKFPDATAKNTFKFDLPKDSASDSYPEVLPVFVQPRKNPWNVWPGLFEESLGIPAADPLVDTLDSESQNSLQNWLNESNPANQLEKLLFQGTDEDEKRTNKMIADFFAEEARNLNEHDIAKYSTNIEISKIEIYEEDIKRYHQGLKYHRGPVDHDIIFTTVETALNFIEKLAKEREQKKKVSFLPELLEKCLKGKAKRDKEKEEEERKKQEKEEKKKNGSLKPKMWLVFNRLSKEKVIICTPGEFYDSD